MRGRYDLLFKKLRLSSIPEYILQQYKFNKEDFVGRFCPNDDGNCGWRAASLVMFNDEKHYYTLKEIMRAGLKQEEAFFKQLFGSAVFFLVQFQVFWCIATFFFGASPQKY